MDKQETLKKVISRALLAAVGGGALLTAATAAEAQNIQLQKYVAVMSLEEEIEWLKKGGPRFCEMIDFDSFHVAEFETLVDVAAVQQVAQRNALR